MGGGIIVFDLDHTLVHSKMKDFAALPYSQRKRIKQQYGSRLYMIRLFDPENKGDDDHTSFYGFLRPGVTETLQWAHDNFDAVIIWTLGSASYARKIVPIIYRDLPSLRPDYVFSAEVAENNPTGQLYKPLGKLKKLCDIPIPLERTMLIDDQPYNVDPNDGGAILIPGFHIRQQYMFQDLERKDIALYQIRQWFQKQVKDASDWRKVSKSTIFV